MTADEELRASKGKGKMVEAAEADDDDEEDEEDFDEEVMILASCRDCNF